MAQPNVSVVICAFTEDRWDELHEAVDSVMHQSLPPREIVLVIDHSPTLLDRARRGLSGVSVIENVQPRGLSGARNSGLGMVHGSVVAFLDDDASAAPDWLERLATAYGSPRVLGVGGAIEPVWLSARPAWFPDEFAWVVGCSYRGLPNTPSPVRNLIGANMSFRTEALRAVGGFRNGYGTLGSSLAGACRCEETELCIRLRQRWPDGLLLLEPAARVRHHVPATRACWSYFQQRCYGEGLSKAALVDLVGAAEALGVEKRYVLSTLTRGIWRQIRRAFVQRDWAALGEAAAIAGGLSATAAGYARGRLSAKGFA
jgi:glycosyltransferase involved in cell wall biosynthesis